MFFFSFFFFFLFSRVTQHYYVQDVCSPSRAAFQTGRYPIHTTVNDWLRGGGYLPVNETLIPQKLKARGRVRGGRREMSAASAGTYDRGGLAIGAAVSRSLR